MNYDPALGRMHQVDPMTDKYASFTPYNYSFNSPAMFNDPSGADPDYVTRRGVNDPGSVFVSNPDFGLNVFRSQSSFFSGQSQWTPNSNSLMYSGGMTVDQYSQAYTIVSGINTALNSTSNTNGGSVNVMNGQVSFYGNGDEAFAAGYAYNEHHNSWGNTAAGSAQATVAGYQWAKELGSFDMKNTYASLDGPGNGDPDNPKPLGHKASDWYNTTLGSVLNLTSLTLIGEETLTALQTTRVLNAAGLGITLYTIYDEEKVSTSSALDLLFGGLAFTPAAPASLVYFGVNFGSLMYNGKSIGENINENFIIVPMMGPSPFILIPRHH